MHRGPTFICISSYTRSLSQSNSSCLMGFLGNGSRTGSSFRSGPRIGSGTLCATMPSMGSSSPDPVLPPAVALTPGLALALKPSWAPALMNPILAPAKAPAAVAVHPPVCRQPKEPMFQVFPLFLKIKFLLVVIPKSLTPGNLEVEEVQHILRYVLPQ